MAASSRSSNVEGNVFASLEERAAALKHDLGKYVAWFSTNVTAWDPPSEDALEALRSDVLRTRTCDGRAEPCWDVWERLTGDLPRPLAQPELRRVEQAVLGLEAMAPHLKAGTVSSADVAQIRGAQAIIREQLRLFQRRLREEG